MVTRKQEPHIPSLEVSSGTAIADQQGRAKPDGASDPAGEAGWFLQRERELRGLSLEDAAVNTGIHAFHIEAIEYGDMTHMPPRADALEMIAAYADFLGFEPEPLLEHYVSFLPQPALAPRHHPANPAPLSSAKVLTFGKFVKLPAINVRLPNLPHMPGGNGGIVASVTAAFLLFSGLAWMFVPGGNQAPPAEQIASADQPELAGDPMPTASTGPETAEITVTETPLDGAALAGVDPGAEPSGESQIDPDLMGAFIQKNLDGMGTDDLSVATTDPLPPATAEGGRVFGAAEDKARVVLKASRSIWLLIEDSKGNRIATQLLNAGDIYRVPDQPGLVATVQDGGAITYLIDGIDKGVLGEPGAVLAAEPLDVVKLEARGS